MFILLITSSTSPTTRIVPTNTRTAASTPDEDASFPLLLSREGLLGIKVMYKLKLVV
jgi:hypothetical protein